MEKYVTPNRTCASSQAPAVPPPRAKPRQAPVPSKRPPRIPEEAPTERPSGAKEEGKVDADPSGSPKPVPPRPPPPKIFGEEDDPSKPVELPEAPAEEPTLSLPTRNPKLYSLMSMGQDSSFWWDSVDAAEEPTFQAEDALAFRFDRTVEIDDDDLEDAERGGGHDLGSRVCPAEERECGDCAGFLGAGRCCAAC